MSTAGRLFRKWLPVYKHTQINNFEILLNQTEIRYYLAFSNLFGTKQTPVWFQINQVFYNFFIWFQIKNARNFTISRITFR